MTIPEFDEKPKFCPLCYSEIPYELESYDVNNPMCSHFIARIKPEQFKEEADYVSVLGELILAHKRIAELESEVHSLNNQIKVRDKADASECARESGALADAQEEIRFYRNEWESACERWNYSQDELKEAKEQLTQAQAEIARLTKELRAAKTLDALLSDNGQICEMHDDIEALEAKVQKLREALEYVARHKDAGRGLSAVFLDGRGLSAVFLDECAHVAERALKENE